MISSPSRVIVSHLHLNYDDQKILEDISFEVRANEVVAVVGPSGTGKSTLIKIIAGLMEPDAGEVTLSSDWIGLAFQNGALFTSMTVYENLLFILEHNTRQSVSDMDQRITEALNLVGMDEARNKYPNELSFGMQKRVGIARALAIYPDIMLYDEPSSGLDPLLANQIEKELRKFNLVHHMATIVVTHELPTIRTLADRVIMLSEGKIVYQGMKDDFFTTKEPHAFQYRTLRDAGSLDI